MNIINVQNKNSQTEAIENARKQLTKLNIAFTNNFVYKIMNILDEKTLFKIKDKARNFQKNIFHMITLLTAINDRYIVLNNDKSNIYQDGQLKLFTETDYQQKSLLQNFFKKLYLELTNKLTSYENFISKNIKLADKVEKKDKKQEYIKQEAKNKTQICIADSFKDLNDASLLLYIKQYERLVNKFKIAEEKANTMSFSNGEQELIINIDFMKMEVIYEIAEEKLKTFDKLYEDIFDEDIQEFKKTVVKLSKNINDFNNKVNMIEKTR